MDTKSTIFSLGAIDPEMRAVKYLLAKKGYRYTYAQRHDRRCNSSNAYIADSLSRYSGHDKQIVWVECRSSLFNHDRDLIVDHHNPGDPGYDASPANYWEGSSIGQVSSLVGGLHDEFKLVAASDHCLSAAMRGDCPGVDPSALMNWRITARSAMASIQPWLLRRRIERAVERIDALPTLNFEGEKIVDASFDRTPELRDAAAVANVPILTTRMNAAGNIKVNLYGARPDVVTRWLQMMQASGLTDSTYGNPFREYAGALFSTEASNRLIAGNRWVS